ncbi:MAG: DUF4293 domain-containing protein [Bacteroidia bacterium]|nr:DUF4293 domain-containing protein [Bacteroidia bacterium]
MIQRIQTVFLILAIACNVASLFLPLWSGGIGDMTETVQGLSVEHQGQRVLFMEHDATSKTIAHTGYVALVALSSIWLLLVIFQYSNRVRQVTRTYLGMLMICLEILALVWLTMQAQGAEAGPEVGGLAPILALVFAWLAARAINKDEALVKSADRFR